MNSIPCSVSAAACAWVIIPRSPTSTTCSIPKRSDDRAGRVGQGLLVCDVALVHADRDRPPLRRACQPVGDLQLALDAVARVAKFGQRAAAPLQIARGQVIEHEPLAGEVASGERLLDPLLALQQPVHRRQQLGLGDLAELELVGQRRLCVPAGVGAASTRAAAPAGRSSPRTGRARGNARVRSTAPGQARAARPAPPRRARAVASARSRTHRRDRPARPASIARSPSIIQSSRCDRFPTVSLRTPVLAIGAPQQRGLVLPILVPTPARDHMHSRTLTSHARRLAHQPDRTPTPLVTTFYDPKTPQTRTTRELSTSPRGKVPPSQHPIGWGDTRRP